ncbi:CAAX amino terminal protease self- immunity [Gimesia maris]|uniref:CAAX amino terminal protease self-immunity n=2 Tax=Gimesia maris TaxID=122 RepID=A0ABX5YN57_9PLAN|nr:CAAX amino terminal protease self- immunity [Gimesia maris]QEG17118.1 CAAX amino terminal protease self- immunity [Gimesia maris]QGQ29781.1 CPBP family intramembrane metalloprotease [Gimesia maris]
MQGCLPHTFRKLIYTMAASENPSSEQSEPVFDSPGENEGPQTENFQSDPLSEDSKKTMDDLLNEAVQVAGAEEAPRLTRTVRPPGPGLFESIFWLIGVILAHFAGMIVFLFGFFALLMATNQLPDTSAEMREQLTGLTETHTLELAGVEQGVFVFIVIAAVALRFGKGVLSKLNLQPFAVSTGFLLLICVLPLSMLSGEFYRIAYGIWTGFAEQIPWLQQFDKMQTMEIVKDMAEKSSLWALVLVIAVCPAIGEELVFRGAIGRGLLARWGLIPGILITSVMFGIVHMHPAHAIAVIPLGMFMHFVYVVTKSFWAPVLVHFLNNAFAVTVAKMMSQFPENAAKLGDESQSVHPLITLAAVAFLIVVCLYLWKTRVRYIKPNGGEWTPGYLSNEKPPAGAPITMERSTAAAGFYPGLAVLFVNFLAMMYLFGMEPEAEAGFLHFITAF